MTLLGPVSPRPAFLRHSFPCVLWAQLLHIVISSPLINRFENSWTFHCLIKFKLSRANGLVFNAMMIHLRYEQIKNYECSSLLSSNHRNLDIYPGCCVPLSLALLCSTLYALAVKGWRWILWHIQKREQEGAQPLMGMHASMQIWKAKVDKSLWFAFASLVSIALDAQYILMGTTILWTKLYLLFWCSLSMALICPLLS